MSRIIRAISAKSHIPSQEGGVAESDPAPYNSGSHMKFSCLLCLAAAIIPATAVAQKLDFRRMQRVYEQGLRSEAAGQHEQALEALDKVLELAPDYPEA